MADKPRVLVVDDSNMILMILQWVKDTLEADGFEVALAEKCTSPQPSVASLRR